MINVNEKVKEARMSLIRTEPFYASILLNLELIEFPEGHPCKTFGVNSKQLGYNAGFAMGLGLKTIKIVLHHEVLHLVFQHHLRGSNLLRYDHGKFNIAGDLAINSHLWYMDGFPEDGLVPGRDEYLDFPMGLSAEEYYKMLLLKEDESEDQDDSSQDDSQDDESGEDTEDKASQNSSQDDSDENEDGDSEDDKSQPTFGDFEECSGEEIEKEIQKVREMTMRAVAATQMAGVEIPTCVKEKLDSLMGKAKVPWKIVLRNALSASKRYGINWMKPSRRNQGDFIMPSRQVRTPGGLWFVADTSCSMTKKDLHDGLTECQAALDLTGELRHLQFDTRIQFDEVITKDTKIETIPLCGRGGTRFQCVVDFIKESKDQPKVLVVLTDLYIEKLDWSIELGNMKVIWLCTNNLKAQSGLTVNINEL